jgi:hypothetical protein
LAWRVIFRKTSSSAVPPPAAISKTMRVCAVCVCGNGGGRTGVRDGAVRDEGALAVLALLVFDDLEEGHDLRQVRVRQAEDQVLVRLGHQVRAYIARNTSAMCVCLRVACGVVPGNSSLM